MSKPFDRIADRYEQTRGGAERGTRFAEAIAPYLDPTVPAVEIGTGTGVVLAALAERGIHGYGLDLSMPMLLHARRKLPGRLVQGDAMSLPLRDGSVTQALSVWVLHLVGDAETVVGEVSRVLRPGGVWVVAHPASPRDEDLEADPVLAITHRMGAGLRPGPRPGGTAHLRRVAPVHGFTVEDVTELRDTAYEESPRQAAERIEERTWSLLWDLSEGDWRRHVEPALASLRELPEPDVPVRRRSRQEVVVLRRGGIRRFAAN